MMHELEPFVERALEVIHREYPSHMTHLLTSDGDARPPRELTPIFYGSFDWHSSVHGHWTLVRALRLGLDGALGAGAVEALGQGFTANRAAAETEYQLGPGRDGFERPYGLAWLLQLCAELREWQSPQAREWHLALAPLESV